MRPDTRSFSFTWMKGQSQKLSQHQKFEDVDDESKGEMETERKPSSSTKEENQEKISDDHQNWGVSRGNSGSRLRKLSHSLVRLGGVGRYSNMNEDLEDENKWEEISEQPISLEEEDDEDQETKMDVQMMEPDVIPRARTNQEIPVPRSHFKKRTVPFQPLELGNNDIGRGSDGGLGENSGMSLSKRLNKTVQGVKASLGNFSQRFRRSTRRRNRLPSTPGSVASPGTRKILGRTPTKLYSPFGIETPVSVKTPKRLADRPSTPRLARKSMVASLVYSPSNNFRRDLDEARRGMRDFQILSRDITRRSVRF